MLHFPAEETRIQRGLCLGVDELPGARGSGDDDLRSRDDRMQSAEGKREGFEDGGVSDGDDVLGGNAREGKTQAQRAERKEAGRRKGR